MCHGHLHCLTKGLHFSAGNCRTNGSSCLSCGSQRAVHEPHTLSLPLHLNHNVIASSVNLHISLCLGHRVSYDEMILGTDVVNACNAHHGIHF